MESTTVEILLPPLTYAEAYAEAIYNSRNFIAPLDFIFAIKIL